jgi:preprotein translocase subunit SecY
VTNLAVFARAFRTPDLRKKLLFTGGLSAVFRFGSNLPVPGISEQDVRYCAQLTSSGGIFPILNLLSGNSLLHLTVFAITRANNGDRRLVTPPRSTNSARRLRLVCRDGLGY